MAHPIRRAERRSGSTFHVVVFSCGRLGIDVANRLRALPQVTHVTLVTCPWRQVRRSLWGKLRHVYRMQGLPGLLSVVATKLRRDRQRSAVPEPPPLAGGIGQLVFDDFHSVECRTAVQALRPDLGVLAGTYILRESVFAIPRLGSVNLHCGKVPEYRGAAPAFWELYNGEREVGVTVHQVESRLDAGGVYRQEAFPLDPAPAGDPLDYLARVREQVLQPAGVRLLADTVVAFAQGDARAMPQDPGRARTYRSPDYRAIRELRRRVTARRADTQPRQMPCGKSV